MDENENQDNISEIVDNKESKSSNTVVILVVIAFLLLIGGVFLFQSRNSKVPSQTPQEMTNNEEGQISDEIIEEGEFETVDVEAGSFYFEPNEIEVMKGEKVRVVLKAVDLMHDFVIDDLGVKSDVVNSGESVIIEFDAAEVGEFEFYCSVGNHKAQGMVGTLKVLDQAQGEEEVMPEETEQIEESEL